MRYPVRALSFTVGILVATACSTLPVYRIKKLHVPNRSGKLTNGLRVILHPDDSMAEVLVTVRYDVGAAHDPKDKKGLAHLVEHLAFRINDEITTQPTAPLAPLTFDESSTTGNVAQGTTKTKRRVHRVGYLSKENAYTSVDETYYYARVVPAHLDDVLADFAQQMGDFSDQIKDDVFETERQVVHNERRTRYESSPLARWYLDLYDRLYPPSHPYQGHAVIGSHETIANIEKADVSAFLRRHYHPSNATLTVSGPIDPQTSLTRVLQHFGDKPKHPPSVTHREPWTSRYRREVIVVPKATETLITVAWPLGPRFSHDAIAMDLLSRAMGGRFSNRLARNRGWAYWAWSGVLDRGVESVFVAQASLKKTRYVDEARAKILEISALLDGYLSPEDLAQARRRMTYTSLFNAENQHERVESMAEFYSRFSEPVAWVRQFNQAETFDVARVREVARRILMRDRAFVLIHTPRPLDPGNLKAIAGASQSGGDDGRPDYTASVASAAGDGRDVHENRDTLPKVYDFTLPFESYVQWGAQGAAKRDRATEIALSNGIRCRIVQAGTLPLTSVTALVRGGRFVEPEDKHGVAHIMLQDADVAGRANRSHIYRMGMRLSFYVDHEWARYSARFPSFYADRAMEVFAHSLRAPQFSAQSIRRVRDAYRQELGDAETNVGPLARRAFWRARGMEQLAPVVTQASVARVGLGDVREIYNRVVYPGNIVLSVSSNLPPQQLEPLLETHFGSWRPSGRPPVDIGMLSTGDVVPPKERLIGVKVPKSTQTQIMIGFDAPGWQDWKGASRARAVASLLEEKAERLRKALGVTYGVHARVWMVKNRGMLWLTARVERGATKESLRQLHLIVQQVREHRCTQGELDLAKRLGIAIHAVGSATSIGRSRHQANLMLHERPNGFHKAAVSWIATMTLEDLQRAKDALLQQPGTVVVAGEVPEYDAAADPDLARIASSPILYDASDLL